MYDYSRFFADFVKAYGYLGPSSYHAGTLDSSAKGYIEMCFKVYQNAATNPLGSLVVGRIVKKDGNARPINLEQIGRGLDDIERANFGTTNDVSGGSVLDSQYWSIAMNDAWLMGGIHAHLDFYVASPRTEQNLLDPKFDVTVTGREIFGLTTFGYTVHPNTRLGEVYVCTDEKRASAATFVAYTSKFGLAKAGDGFRQLVAAQPA